MTDSKNKLKDSGLIDWSVFQEILQMDEDEEGFSKQLVETFVFQVEETFEKIEKFIDDKNLEDLSKEGHFLKGSAAALGLTSISEQCERIQNYGHKNNFDNFKPTKKETVNNKEEEEEEPKENGKKVEEEDKKVDEKVPEKSTEPNTTTEDDKFWILAIEDALSKAKDGFYKTKKALDEFYDE
ncbi:YPD1 [Candida jiufengensis]|uniref:YPD1 n=1 Tax=Candida jiufengensis TaxID=497108 RepID=UPI00222563E4|nr:YPD1 [Candida jiufengensis]KAI5951337.1 YPD1 [Candida jiufengensis]